MIVTDEYVSALRAFLGGEGDEEWARLAGYLIARDGAEREHPVDAAGVALHVITRQRFALGYRDEDITAKPSRSRAKNGVIAPFLARDVAVRNS